MLNQGGRSWRASGDRQISLNASAERALANFRDKKHRILQLQIFATSTLFFCASADSPVLALKALCWHYESCASVTALR